MRRWSQILFSFETKGAFCGTIVPDRKKLPFTQSYFASQLNSFGSGIYLLVYCIKLIRLRSSQDWFTIL